MNVSQAIRVRRSVRNYTSKKVEQEKLDKIIKSGMLAPSANNKQEWRFIVVKDAKIRGKLKKAAKQNFIGEVPVVIAACALTDEHVMTCGEKCYPIDVAAAVDHIILQAVEEGLGTCWIGAFSPDKVKEILHIPDNVKVVSLLTLGYPREPLKIHKKNRKSPEEITHLNRWQS